MKKYWLMKSEPVTFSIDHLEKTAKQTTCWEGVRNYQARNFMRDEMKKGDLAFYYHSNCDVPGIVGIVEIVREAYPDLSALDPKSDYYDPKSTRENPRWVMVDIQLRKRFDQIISLKDLREDKRLKDMILLRPGNRLSITPVTEKEWEAILRRVGM